MKYYKKPNKMTAHSTEKKKQSLVFRILFEICKILVGDKLRLRLIIGIFIGELNKLFFSLISVYESQNIHKFHKHS